MCDDAYLLSKRLRNVLFLSKEHLQLIIIDFHSILTPRKARFSPDEFVAGDDDSNS